MTMKFKPTIAKSIVSLLGGIGAFFLSTEIFSRPGKCLPDPSTPGAQLCVDYGPSPIPLIISIVVVIFIYTIWSLVTTKKNK